MKNIHKQQEGIVHHLGLIILLLAVLGLMGFAGYRVWQARETAKAETWDQVSYVFMNPGEFSLYACKVDDQMAKVFIKNNSNHTLKLSTGTNTLSIKPNSNAGPYNSKWVGNVSWNNISNQDYSLEGVAATISSC